jgi:GH24 family phage-related lysozyme (muramidase)
MTLPAPGLALIKEFEGCHLKAYPDPLSGGLPITIGWGTTRKKDGSPFKLGDTITQQEADELLITQCEKQFLPSLTRIPHWTEMSPEQQGALLSFAYNLGAGFVGDTSNFRSINAALASKANWKDVPAALYKYRNPGTSVEKGLARRRTAEGDSWKRGMSPVFRDNETVVGATSGTSRVINILVASGGTGNYIVGEVVTGATSGATGEIVSWNSAATTVPVLPVVIGSSTPKREFKISKVLLNFFKFYDENNANHQSAVGLLESAIPEHLKQDSPWVVAYRGGNAAGGAPDLHKFFEFFSERNAGHVEGVSLLEEAMASTDPGELIDDGAGGAQDAAWIEKYRAKPPTPSILAVPYFNQVDNYRDAHRTCNSSACAMCLAFLKPGAIKGDDEYVKKVFAIGDTTDHSVQTKVLASYGVKSSFSYNLSFADIDKSLAAGKPVVIGILHRGSLSAPTGGHMCVVIGKKGDGYVINDPYGSCNDGYTGPVTNGKGTLYSRALLKSRWCPGGTDGWGRIFS